MELKVIGSGSAGNCYVLENNNTALIIECGVSWQKLQKAMNYKTHKIIGCILSHSHEDHSKYVNSYILNGVEIFAHKDTLTELGLQKSQFATLIDPLCDFEIDEYIIKPFDLIHDVTCIGYQITHPDFGNLVFITDTQQSVYSFSNVNYWVVECNYSDDILTKNVINGSINYALAKRITENHMSIEALLCLFEKTNMSKSIEILLIHGSNTNSHSVNFKEQVELITGVPTKVAECGLKIDLNNELI